MTLRNSLPEKVARPVGLGSLLVMILGLAFGYVLFMTGLSTYFGHTVPADDLSSLEAVAVSGIGVGLVVLGYFGWKGFLYFSY